MLTDIEIEELKFYSNKVKEVHGGDHIEYIRINDIVSNIDNNNLDKKDFIELQKLTNNYIIPEGACKAQTILLNLLIKLDNNI